jgi:hypothetical protein
MEWSAGYGGDEALSGYSITDASVRQLLASLQDGPDPATLEPAELLAGAQGQRSSRISLGPLTGPPALPWMPEGVPLQAAAMPVVAPAAGAEARGCGGGGLDTPAQEAQRVELQHAAGGASVLQGQGAAVGASGTQVPITRASLSLLCMPGSHVQVYWPDDGTWWLATVQEVSWGPGLHRSHAVAGIQGFG